MDCPCRAKSFPSPTAGPLVPLPHGPATPPTGRDAGRIASADHVPRPPTDHGCGRPEGGRGIRRAVPRDRVPAGTGRLPRAARPATAAWKESMTASLTGPRSCGTATSCRRIVARRRAGKTRTAAPTGSAWRSVAAWTGRRTPSSCPERRADGRPFRVAERKHRRRATAPGVYRRMFSQDPSQAGAGRGARMSGPDEAPAGSPPCTATAADGPLVRN